MSQSYTSTIFALAAFVAVGCSGTIDDAGVSSGLAQDGAGRGAVTEQHEEAAGARAAAGRAGETPAPAGKPAAESGGKLAVAECGTGLSTCGGQCVSLNNDAANCGACGKACAAGLTCHEGLCRCGAGFDMCGGSCVQIARDPKHCGECGHACRGDESCIAGNCGCAVGQLRCGESCVSVTSDRNNCGACGTVCDAGDKCANSTCVLDCASGLTACGETCVNTTNDVMHCGNCTTVCMAGQTCNRSRCR